MMPFLTDRLAWCQSTRGTNPPGGATMPDDKREVTLGSELVTPLPDDVLSRLGYRVDPHRQTYVPDLARQSERPQENTSVSGKPQRTEAPTNDLAVFGFCELWALAFGFPPVEELYHGAPVSTRMVTFMAIGGAFAALGPTWPFIKARFPRRWSVSFVRTASDFRAWLAAFVAIFIFMYGPELYNRVQQPPAAPISLVPAAPAPAATSANEIPGIPATKGGISQALDIILPGLSSLINGEGMKVSSSLRSLPNEAPNLLVNSSRSAATARVDAARADLKKFEQDLLAFKNQYKLDSKWINWTIGNDGFLEDLLDSLDQFNQVLGRITLPPAYSPPMLIEFWRAGGSSASLSDQSGNFANWLSGIQTRIQTAHDTFEKKISSGVP